MKTFMRVLLVQNTQVPAAKVLSAMVNLEVLKDQDKMAIKPMKTMKRSPLVPVAKVLLLAMENLEVLKNLDKMAMKTFMRVFFCLETLEMKMPLALDILEVIKNLYFILLLICQITNK